MKASRYFQDIKYPVLVDLLFVLFVPILFLAPAPTPIFALDDDEFGGYAADALTVRVGYFGGPYYEKAVFSLDELWGMDVVYADYTLIDNMPSVVINHAAGVSLADVTEAAGIDLGSVQSFDFWTNDKTGGYYVSLSKRFLIDTPRYCYYSLPDNFDYETGEGNEYALLEAVRVPTILALADDWNRALAGASFGSDYLNLNTNTRLRLLFGQTDAKTRTAANSAKWVHAVDVTLGGAPTIVTDAAVLELEVGSRFNSGARVIAADPVIEANAVIEWRSGDENVASVDENGTITVHAEGSALITASFGGAEFSVSVSGTAAGGAAADGGEAAEEAAEEAPVPAVAAETPLALVLRPAAISREDIGGEQSRRTEEMAETASELSDISAPNPLLPPAGAALALSFAAGALSRFARYRADISPGPRGRSGRPSRT
jgi:hypothetical protein